MRDTIALEEHVTTEAMNALWDDAGEASRNGTDYMDWVQERLLDIPKRLARGQRDRLGPERNVVGRALFATGVGLAWLSPWGAYGLYAAVALLWLVPDRRLVPEPGGSR